MPSGKIEELKNDLRGKDKIIADYDEKCERMEEDLQKSRLARKAAKAKATAAEQKLASALSELAATRKENQGLALAREREAGASVQERVELVKTVSALEMQLKCLGREKKELEARYAAERKISLQKARSVRLPTTAATVKVCIHAGVQTDPIPAATTADPELSAKLRQCEARIVQMSDYENSLAIEIKTLQMRLSAAAAASEKKAHEAEEKETAAKFLESQVALLKEENAELKRRREAARIELSRLGRRSASAVKPRAVSAGVPTVQCKHREFARAAKRDLEGVYKDFVLTLFQAGSPAGRQVQDEIRAIERRINQVIENLTDFCEEEEREESTPQGSYLVARFHDRNPKGDLSASVIMDTPTKFVMPDKGRKRVFSKQLAFPEIEVALKR